MKIKRRRESEAVGRGMAAAPMAAHGGGVEKLPYEGDGAFVVEGDMWKASCNHPPPSSSSHHPRKKKKPIPPADIVFPISVGWSQVGERYELLRSIGKGSFSVVCLARDNKTGEFVAVKKIKDVFVHKNNAKNVIREVYIQRRLRHPNVVDLKDLFMMPSPTGKWKMVSHQPRRRRSSYSRSIRPSVRRSLIL